MIYKAKTLVTYNEVLRQIGETFEVSDADAKNNGWDVKNSTVELVKEVSPESTPAPETATPAAGDVAPTEPAATDAMTTTPAPETATPAAGDGETNNA